MRRSEETGTEPDPGEGSAAEIALEVAELIERYDPSLLDAFPGAMAGRERIQELEHVPFLDAIVAEESLVNLDVDQVDRDADLGGLIAKLRSRDFIARPKNAVNLLSGRNPRPHGVTSSLVKRQGRRAKSRPRRSTADAASPIERSRTDEADSSSETIQVLEGTKMLETHVQEERAQEPVKIPPEGLEARREEARKWKKEADERWRQEEERARSLRRQRELNAKLDGHVRAVMTGEESLRARDESELRRIRDRAAEVCFSEQSLSALSHVGVLARHGMVSEDLATDLDKVTRNIVRGLNYLSATYVGQLFGETEVKIPEAFHRRGKKCFDAHRENLRKLDENLEEIAACVEAWEGQMLRASSSAVSVLAANRELPTRCRAFIDGVIRLGQQVEDARFDLDALEKETR